jgi:hypothetical protein
MQLCDCSEMTTSSKVDEVILKSFGYVIVKSGGYPVLPIRRTDSATFFRGGKRPHQLSVVSRTARIAIVKNR